ncbi:hypothetical protein EX238_20685, partial [Providencia rettgeri]|nr:hypothetical protein [Providencia rettgeri]
MKKIGRNDPCICGSGRKYKYCCKGFEPRNRNPHNPSELINPEGMEKLKGWMNVVSAQEEALRCFCKDNGFYYFKAMSIAENFNIYDKLSINALTKDDFFVCYKKQTTHEYVVRMFQTAVRQSEAFKKRETILNSAVKSHFDGAYELSIHTFFIIIEGVLRDIGGLDLKQKF